MKKDNVLVLNKIIKHKSQNFNMEKEKRDHTGPVVSMFYEDYLLWSYLRHPGVSALEIRCSINIEEDFVKAVWFPSPTLVTPETRTDFVLLANEANYQLHSLFLVNEADLLHPFGRFWCDNNNDFAYEVALPEKIIEECELEAARQLFDLPYANFYDLQVPLLMLKDSTWDADTATRYLIEKRRNGYVDNTDYNL